MLLVFHILFLDMPCLIYYIFTYLYHKRKYVYFELMCHNNGKFDWSLLAFFTNYNLYNHRHHHLINPKICTIFCNCLYFFLPYTIEKKSHVTFKNWLILHVLLLPLLLLSLCELTYKAVKLIMQDQVYFSKKKNQKKNCMRFSALKISIKTIPLTTILPPVLGLFLYVGSFVELHSVFISHIRHLLRRYKSCCMLKFTTFTHLPNTFSTPWIRPLLS